MYHPSNPDLELVLPALPLGTSTNSFTGKSVNTIADFKGSREQLKVEPSHVSDRYQERYQQILADLLTLLMQVQKKMIHWTVACFAISFGGSILILDYIFRSSWTLMYHRRDHTPLPMSLVLWVTFWLLSVGTGLLWASQRPFSS